jgi:hypothetical protein
MPQGTSGGSAWRPARPDRGVKAAAMVLRGLAWFGTERQGR